MFTLMTGMRDRQDDVVSGLSALMFTLHEDQRIKIGFNSTTFPISTITFFGMLIIIALFCASAPNVSMYVHLVQIAFLSILHTSVFSDRVADSNWGGVFAAFFAFFPPNTKYIKYHANITLYNTNVSVNVLFLNIKMIIM